jgi:tetratricopeptide (TPR) repeat protein
MQNAFAQDIDSLLTKFSATKDDSLRYEIVLSLFLRYSESDPALFLKTAQKLMLYSQKNNEKTGEAYATGMIGYNYRGVGNSEKSLEYALKADEIAHETGNEILLAFTNNVLGDCYKDLGNYPKALNYSFASAEIGTRLKDSKKQSIAFQNIADVYLAMGKIDSALMYAQKDYELCMRIGFSDYIGYTFEILGVIHGKMGNTALAISYFDMAIREGLKIKSPKQLNWAYTSKAQYFNDLNQKDSSIFYARKAIITVENTSFTNYSLKPSKLLLDNYRNTNVDSAFKYSEMYRITNDSVFSAKAIQQTQLMTFENEMKQQELAAEKIKIEAERKQNIQYALIALGIIVLLTLYLLLSRSFITNTKLIEFFGVVALLIVFEFLNLLLHPFLERITHHSPVLMLLALVCIAALLVPLHHKVEHWATAKLVEKNKQIRLAAAKKTIEQLENN